MRLSGAATVCSHLIVGAIHAGPVSGFYPPYAAQELLQKHGEELGRALSRFKQIALRPVSISMSACDQIPPERGADLSVTELLERLASVARIRLVHFPEVVTELLSLSARGPDKDLRSFSTGLAGPVSHRGQACCTNCLEWDPLPALLCWMGTSS